MNEDKKWSPAKKAVTAITLNMGIAAGLVAATWAEAVRKLVEEDYPDGERIVLVMDNLNTHLPSSLYEAFEPGEVRRIAERLEFHYTPKHGSWLNMAESELAVLARQCLDCRMPNLSGLGLLLKGSDGSQPHLENSSAYRQNRPTQRGSDPLWVQRQGLQSPQPHLEDGSAYLIGPLSPATSRLVRRGIPMLGCAREYGQISVSAGANASRPRKQVRNPEPLLQAWPFTSQLWSET